MQEKVTLLVLIISIGFFEKDNIYMQTPIHERMLLIKVLNFLSRKIITYHY